MAGIRLAAVYVIAWATHIHIGAGGLGDLDFSGLNNYQPDLILAGTIPVTILALLADWLLGLLEHRLTPIALRRMKNETYTKNDHGSFLSSYTCELFLPWSCQQYR